MEPDPEVRAPERAGARVEVVDEVREEVEAVEEASQQAPAAPVFAPTVVKE